MLLVAARSATQGITNLAVLLQRSLQTRMLALQDVSLGRGCFWLLQEMPAAAVLPKHSFLPSSEQDHAMLLQKGLNTDITRWC